MGDINYWKETGSDWAGTGLAFINFKTALSPSTYTTLIKDILTSFYLPGFMWQPNMSDSNFNSAKWRGSTFDNTSGITAGLLIKTNSETGTVPLYSNWMLRNEFKGLTADWQEIGFVVPRQARNYVSDDNVVYTPVPFDNQRGLLYFYSPYYCVYNSLWDRDKICVNNFFKNVSTPYDSDPDFKDGDSPGVTPQKHIAMKWPIRVGEFNSSNKYFTFAPSWSELNTGIVGIHVPDWSNKPQNDTDSNTANVPLPRKVMRLF
jgi:hypothetical protein